MIVNISLDGLGSWFRSKNISAHTIAVIAIGVATAVTTDEQVRNFLVGLFQAHPKIAAGIFAAAGIILKYSHSSSAAGTVANAQSIQASPNPPTATAVKAAQTDPTLPVEPAQL